MHNIVTAIGNETINTELKKISDNNILYSDIVYQDALIEISKNAEISTIILYQYLPGEDSIENVILKIRENNKIADIILLIEKESEDLRKACIYAEVNKIVKIEDISIEYLNELIKQENVKSETNIIKESINREEGFLLKNTKIITFCGQNGAGKSTCLVNIAGILAREKNKKVLIMDLDILSGNIEMFFGAKRINNVKKQLNDKDCVLNELTDSIQKNIFTKETLLEKTIKCGQYKNVHIVTGNNSMFVCQNILKNEYYDAILSAVKNEYDYILIDTANNMFYDSTKWSIENSDVVYYVLESSYKGIKDLKQFLEICVQVWNININKIKIVINKKNKYSLDLSIIQDVFCKIEIVGQLLEKAEYTKAMNNGILAIDISTEIEEEYMKFLRLKRKQNQFVKYLKYIKEKAIDNKSIGTKK